MRQRESCSSAHALLSPELYPRLEENGRAYVLSEAEPTLPAALSQSRMRSVLLNCCGEYLSCQQRSNMFLHQEKSKLQFEFWKKNIIGPSPLPVINSFTFPTISAERNQTSYSSGQNPHQALLAGKSSASWRKRNFFYFKKSMHAHKAHKHLCHWVGVAVVKKGTNCHCQRARKQALKSFDLLLSLSEQGFYLLQGKWEEILSSSPAWPRTEEGVSPILYLKYQAGTAESCSLWSLFGKHKLKATQPHRS